eukprot:CAMPEP_0194539926 /NCGR_PEP_ID=MMETSP0253-20130528/80041_1 /TAXON_ID=2966 /ORGANISM="Noctiluca scintillans" /LENGTH=277 /DNA_ID=CAMNT_0039386251 /DNA_START=189 /DNA_END=1025 /DNA_ORIENTATION=-
MFKVNGRGRLARVAADGRCSLAASCAAATHCDRFLVASLAEVDLCKRVVHSWAAVLSQRLPLVAAFPSVFTCENVCDSAPHRGRWIAHILDVDSRSNDCGSLFCREMPEFRLNRAIQIIDVNEDGGELVWIGQRPDTAHHNTRRVPHVPQSPNLAEHVLSLVQAEPHEDCTTPALKLNSLQTSKMSGGSSISVLSLSSASHRDDVEKRVPESRKSRPWLKIPAASAPADAAAALYGFAAAPSAGTVAATVAAAETRFKRLQAGKGYKRLHWLRHQQD